MEWRQYEQLSLKISWLISLLSRQSNIFIDTGLNPIYNTNAKAIVWPLKRSYGRIWREGKQMSEIHVKDNESLDSALRRFKRSCAKDGTLAELRKKEYYQSPSVKRLKKSEAARKNKNKR